MLERLAHARARADRPGRGLAAAAVAIFAVTLWFGLDRLPPLPRETRWLLLVLIAIPGVPAAIGMSVGEYVISARILGHRVAPLDALRTSVVATAANSLPIPGSALVRMRALMHVGASLRRAASSTAVVALFWIGVACVAAGLVQIRSPSDVLGWILIGVGSVSLLLGRLLLLTHVQGSRGDVIAGALLGVELGSVTVTAFRYHVALAAFGFSPSLRQSFTLAISVVIASAVGVFPGGLGLRELIAGALASVVGLPSAVGILTAAVDRVIALVVFLPLSVALFVSTLRSGRRRRSSAAQS